MRLGYGYRGREISQSMLSIAGAAFDPVLVRTVVDCTPPPTSVLQLDWLVVCLRLELSTSDQRAVWMPRFGDHLVSTKVTFRGL